VTYAEATTGWTVSAERAADTRRVPAGWCRRPDSTWITRPGARSLRFDYADAFSFEFEVRRPEGRHFRAAAHGDLDGDWRRLHFEVEKKGKADHARQVLPDVRRKKVE